MLQELLDIVNYLLLIYLENELILRCIQVVESDTSTFALDKKKTAKEIDSIIVQSIEKLLSRDDPALEMYCRMLIYSIGTSKHITNKFLQD